MITVKIYFTHLQSSSCQGNNFFIKIMHPVTPNYNSQTDKDFWRNFVAKLYLMSIAKGKDPSIRSKCIKHFLLFLPLSVLYLLKGRDLFDMSCLSENSLMTSLDILSSKPLNLKNETTKIEHKKVFCVPSKLFQNISGPIKICSKYFMTPTKSSGPILHT